MDRLYLDLADFLSIEEGNDFTSTLERTLSERCRILNAMDIRKLTLTSSTIELEVQLASGSKIGTSASRLDGGRFFYPTLPCEDIIVPVDFSKAEGHFRSTYPFRFFDSVVADVEIEVHEGRITAFRSDRNDLVAAYMNIDSMSSCIGEIVLCESLTQAAGFHRSFGIPQLDRMRTSQVVFGGVSPELVTLDDESELAHNGLNTGFARLEIPVGGRDLKVVATLGDGAEVTIFEDGLSALDV